MNKYVLAILSVLLVAGGGYYVYKQNGAPTTKVENTQKIPSTITPETKQIPQESATSSNAVADENDSLMVKEKVTSAPKEWGSLVKTEYLSFDHGERVYKNIFYLTYSNNVEAYYQTGVNKLYWVKLEKTEDCATVNKELNLGHYRAVWIREGVEKKCSIYSDGVYDLDTKINLVFKETNPLYSEDYDGIKHPFPTNIGLPQIANLKGNKESMIFTPRGKYFIQHIWVWEGPGGYNFLSTSDGSVGKMKQGDYYTNISLGNYGTLMISDDDRIISEQVDIDANDEGYITYDMNEFNVLLDGTKLVSVLDYLLRKPIPSIYETIHVEGLDPDKDIEILDLRDKYVKFKVKRTTEYYKAGIYTFDIEKETLSKIN